MYRQTTMYDQPPPPKHLPITRPFIYPGLRLIHTSGHFPHISRDPSWRTLGFLFILSRVQESSNQNFWRTRDFVESYRNFATLSEPQDSQQCWGFFSSSPGTLFKIEDKIGRLSMSWGHREVPSKQNTRGNSQCYCHQISLGFASVLWWGWQDRCNPKALSGSERWLFNIRCECFLFDVLPYPIP
jgi:hypothetical protein